MLVIAVSVLAIMRTFAVAYEPLLPERKLLYIYFSAPNHLLLVSSADNLCKQFGPKSGPTILRAWSGCNLFDIQMVFLKKMFEKVDFEKKITRQQESTKNFQGGQTVKLIGIFHSFNWTSSLLC